MCRLDSVRAFRAGRAAGRGADNRRGEILAASHPIRVGDKQASSSVPDIGSQQGAPFSALR